MHKHTAHARARTAHRLTGHRGSQAYLEVKVLACLILQQLALALEPGHDVSYQPALTISARHGMKMIPALRTEDRAPASSSGPARSACANSQPQCTI
jgi:hypothetical protein